MKGYFEGVIGGLCSGLLLLAIYAVANTWLAGTDAGNWLNFSGVILGVVLTISGTLYLQKLQDRRRDKHAEAILLEMADKWDDIVTVYRLNYKSADVQRLLNLISQIDYFIADFDKSNPQKWLQICDLRAEGHVLVSLVSSYWSKHMEPGDLAVSDTIQSILIDAELPKYSAKIRQVFGEQ